MVVKTKDCCVDLSEFTLEGHGINANKKTALKIVGASVDDIKTKLGFEISGDRLVVTNKDNNTKIFVEKYSNLKYIKTDDNNLVNMLTDGIIFNVNYITTYSKKLVSNGTIYSDTISFENSLYEPIGKNNIKYNKGLKINGKSGNDLIIGTDFNDTIKGEVGYDTIFGGNGEDIIYGGEGFNTIKYNNIEEISGDKIYLKKGENLSIDISKIENAEVIYRVSDKNLVITVNQNISSAEFTIINFGTKDITNNSNSKKNYPDTSSVKLITKNEIIDIRKDAAVFSNSGTYHNDYINKSLSSKSVSIKGLDGDDTIIGSNYSDTIKAGTGMNIVEGLRGDDILYGEKSKESQTTFSFKTGDDNDIIYSGKGYDIIQINKAELSDIKFKQGIDKNNKDLIIQYSDNDSITVKNYYLVDKYGNILGVDNNNSVKQIFVDNSEFILGTPNFESLEGGNGASIIYAMGGNDSIISYAGNDTIYGQQGKDTISAGQGNDYIDGGEWDDTYIFSSGDGNDTIAPCESYFDNDTVIFKENQNLTYSKKFDSSDLVINYNNNSDNITLADYFYDSLKYPLTIINGDAEPQSLKEQLLNNSLLITGSDENDSITGVNDSAKFKNNIIYGYEGNDTICGGLNNDTIIGGTGDDIINIYDKNNCTLVFNSNDGNDTINFWDGFNLKENILKFEDISYSDFTYEKSGDNLIIKYTTKDSITLKDYFKYVTQISGLETNDHSFKISDKNTNVFLSDIVNLEISGQGEIWGTIYNDKINGSSIDDIINGGFGNDTIYSNGGMDCIYGEEGTDVIYGGNNMNYLYGGSGNDIIHVGLTEKCSVNGGLGNDTIYSGIGKEILGNGSQVIELYGDEGDDTYIIESDLTNYIEVGDTKGDNIVQITTKSKEDISLHYTFKENNSNLGINDLYLNNVSNFGKTNYGIRISNFGSEGNQEPAVPSNITVITSDGYFLDYSTVFQTIASITKWLSENNFTSVQLAVSNGTYEQKEELMGFFNNAWQIYDNEMNEPKNNYGKNSKNIDYNMLEESVSGWLNNTSGLMENSYNINNEVNFQQELISACWVNN